VTSEKRLIWSDLVPKIRVSWKHYLHVFLLESNRRNWWLENCLFRLDILNDSRCNDKVVFQLNLRLDWRSSYPVALNVSLGHLFVRKNAFIKVLSRVLWPQNRHFFRFKCFYQFLRSHGLMVAKVLGFKIFFVCLHTRWRIVWMLRKMLK